MTAFHFHWLARVQAAAPRKVVVVGSGSATVAVRAPSRQAGEADNGRQVPAQGC